MAIYADNGQPGGTDGQKKRVKRIRDAARSKGTKVWVTEPGRANSPLRPTEGVRITPVVPDEWPADCNRHPNDYSIGLRIDYCSSSILFTGDAEKEEEAHLEPGDINVLQVGHHGSSTSSSGPFLDATKPEYAVISSAKPNEGTNKGYCHPRKDTIDAISSRLPDQDPSDDRDILAFDGRVKCANATQQNWRRFKASERLFLTARDGKVLLTTTGDGKFSRVQ